MRTWVSPFRSQASEEDPKKKINLYKQFKESNKIEHIKVPVKFSYHNFRSRSQKKKAAEAEAKRPKETKATVTSTEAKDAKEETETKAEKLRKNSRPMLKSH